ncbi:MAG: hypothetical protein LIP12_10740 [Clostridiales bacterium]|nr:hypothetical protein [Clostridiales bacterium]
MKREEEIPTHDFEDLREQEEEKKPFFATKRGNAISMLLMLVIVAGVLAVSIGNSSGASLTFAASETAFGITFANESPLFIEYSDILEVTLTEDTISGTPVDAMDWDSGMAGIYENSEWGEYHLYAYSSTGQYIIIEYSDGILVFNGKNKRETRQIYQKLEKKLNQTS